MAIAGRAEELAHEPLLRDAYDVVIARAVAEMRVLAELCLPYVAFKGVWIAAKANDVTVRPDIVQSYKRHAQRSCCTLQTYNLQALNLSVGTYRTLLCEATSSSCFPWQHNVYEAVTLADTRMLKIFTSNIIVQV
jgi:hypothetical protein